MDNLSVLLVEDSVAQREVMALICRELGIGEVVMAEHGRAALNLIDARDKAFDLMICDLEMPDLDGIELIQLLSKKNSLSAIIVVSGREQSLISAVELMGSTMGLWMLGGVQKPLTKPRLAELIALFSEHNKPSGTLPRRQAAAPVSAEYLREALARRQFLLHFQPQIHMHDHTLAGVEALVRLKLDNDQLMFPGDFIGLCEQYNLIDDLTYEVVRLAVEQIVIWTRQGLNVRVSVNLSAVSFGNDEFCARIMALLAQSKVEGPNLMFEVTETALVKDMGKALAVLAKLRLLGCGLSIDDYGTGYSSVKQLSQFPFTELKVDRSLIDYIAAKPHLQIIFESTLSMCNRLGLSLVAEGVERKADWDFLRMHGCPICQGFYYASPIPAATLFTWWQAGMPAFNQTP